MLLCKTNKPKDFWDGQKNAYAPERTLISGKLSKRNKRGDYLQR